MCKDDPADISITYIVYIVVILCPVQEYDCYRQKMSAASQQWEQEREGLRGDSDRLQSTLAEQRRALDRQKQINNGELQKLDMQG